jgi:hypothetical protein
VTTLNPHLQGFDRLPLAHSDGAGQRFRAKAAVLAIEAVPVVKRLTAGDRLRGLSRLSESLWDLAYRAGVRRAFRLALILLASLFSEGFITWADLTRYTSRSIAR